MSGKVVGWAMEQWTGSPAAKLVLVKLADNANDEGYCWPSPALIVEHTELAQSTVYKHLKGLEDAGLISPAKINVNNCDNAPHYADGWRLSVPLPVQIPRGGKIPNTGKSIPRSGKAIPRRGIAYKEEPSIEPSLNLPLAPSKGELGIAAPPLNGRGDALAKSTGQIAGPEILKGQGGGHTTGGAIADHGRGALATGVAETWAQQRSRALAKQIDEAQFAAWFADAEFVEGPPPTILMSSDFRANWASTRLAHQLRKVFGDDVQVTCRSKQNPCTDEENDDRADDG